MARVTGNENLRRSIMEAMPFTLAHAAAALPFRRLRLFIPSAVVVGTLAPDFAYFLQLTPRGGYGHTFAGAFLWSLPLALLVLWIFHGLVKKPLVQLFPDGIRLRLRPNEPFPFGGFSRFLLLAFSALIGIATHIIWDSFTHRNPWPTRHWALLRESAYLPVLGWLPYYKVLQYASSVIGILVLCAWAVRWYRTTEPRRADNETGMPAVQRWLIAGCIAGGACLAAIVRTITMTGSRGLIHHLKQALIDGVVTAIAVAWWLLVAYAIVVAVRRPLRSRVGV